MSFYIITNYCEKLINTIGSITFSAILVWGLIFFIYVFDNTMIITIYKFSKCIWFVTLV